MGIGVEAGTAGPVLGWTDLIKFIIDVLKIGYFKSSSYEDIALSAVYDVSAS